MATVQQVAQSKSQPSELPASPDAQVENIFAGLGQQAKNVDVDQPASPAESDMANQLTAVRNADREPTDPQSPENQLFQGTGIATEAPPVSPELTPQQRSGIEEEVFFDKLKVTRKKADRFDPDKELEDPIQRGRLAFATNSYELVKGLETKFGSANARVTERGVEFREGPQQDWATIDNEAITNYLDLADGARLIFEGVIENAARTGGFISGFGQGAPVGAATGAGVGTVLAPGPGTVVGGASGFVTGGLLQGILRGAAAGGLGSAAAIQFADKVQEEVLGIERDPNRSALIESSAALALGAGFDFLATKTAKKIASARLAAQQLGENLIHVKNRVNEVTENLDIVNKLGVLKDGKQLKLAPNQMAGDLSPELQEVAKELGTTDGWRNFIIKQGQAIKEAYVGIGQLVGNVQKLSDPDFANKISRSIFSSRRMEGRLIGKFRDQALKKSAGAVHNVNRAGEAFGNLIDQLGVDPTLKGDDLAQAISKLSIDDVVAAFPSLTGNQPQALRGILSKFAKEVREEGMDLASMDRQYTVLRGKLDELYSSKSGLPLASKLTELKNALRDDWTDAIGRELGESAQVDYAKAMDTFSSISKEMGKLNKSLLNSDISREAFVREVFSKKGTSLGQIRAMRALIQENEPQLWRDLTGDYLKTILDDATDTTTKQVDWKKVAGKLSGLGSLKEEIFAGTDTPPEALDAILTIGQHYKKFGTKFKAEPGKKSLPGKVIRAAVVLFSNTLATQKADTTADLVNALGGKDQSFLKFLNAGGAEQVAQFVKETRRPGFLTKLGLVMDTATRKSMEAVDETAGVSGLGKAAVETGRAATKTGIRSLGVETVR